MNSHKDTAVSASLRKALKRGLARQAMQCAEREQAEISEIISELRGRPLGEKARTRLARRLRNRAGVVRAAMTPDLKSIILVLRNVRNVLTRSDGVDLFSEPQLVYTRLVVTSGRTLIRFAIDRISFCAHALERLVERSSCGLSFFLDVVDQEASRLLRWIASDRVLHESGDCYLGCEHGVWAGSLDEAEPEPGWFLRVDPEARRMPIFSIRTYLGEAQMKPLVWLLWQESRKTKAMSA
ncbi:hypothetical protein [Sedimentimonas flavescens]|uniref:hypothetical protein n=1 Tax=Sedimentimonas flavescens TaxID=2851012 RepID=UPI001C4A3680|nr:hypothetical protein [Sedimentimonas flavescens]MBW0158411.1 hypothetical protein [Sedimentimonas flavescens]